MTTPDKIAAWKTYTAAIIRWNSAIKTNPDNMRALADAACEYAGHRVARHVAEAYERCAVIAETVTSITLSPLEYRHGYDAGSDAAAAAIRAAAKTYAGDGRQADVSVTPEGASLSKNPGVTHPGCGYLGPEGGVCNKCGYVDEPKARNSEEAIAQRDEARRENAALKAEVERLKAQRDEYRDALRAALRIIEDLDYRPDGDAANELAAIAKAGRGE